MPVNSSPFKLGGFALCALLVVLWATLSPPTFAQSPDTTQYQTMTTEWQGSGMCLDVVNDGKANNKLQLAKCGNFSGQYWKITPAKGTFVRLTTEWQGDDMCLDVVNDGKANNQLQLAKCGNFSGQHWSFAPTGKSL